MERIGRKIKELRVDMGITQAKLAKALGITQDSVSLWENGKRLPDTQYVIAICRFFDASADYLLGIKE